MLREEQNRLLKGLINHLDLKTNVDAGGIMRTPADTYTCEERFNLEWESFFKNHPQIIGPVSYTHLTLPTILRV